MNYTDGKNRQESARNNLTLLLGTRASNPYGTLDKETFLKKLSNMTLEEKGMLCNKVNVRPNPRSHFMEAELIKSFDQFVLLQPIIVETEEKKFSKVDYANPPQSLKDLL